MQAGHHGASDALDNNPPPQSALPSQTELTLLSRVVELFGAIRQQAAVALNALHAEISSRRESFTQERYEGRVRSIEASMRALLNRHGGELEQRVYDALKAKAAAGATSDLAASAPEVAADATTPTATLGLSDSA